MHGYPQVNLKDILKTEGSEKTKEILSKFSCP